MFSPEQYEALRQTAGVVERTDRRVLRLTGSDRRSYLQGLLTNDITALAAGTGCYAALLTPQGRMVSDMRVLETGNAVLIDLDASVAPAVRDRLDQFIFSEDVQIDDLSGSHAIVGVYGPRAAATVRQVLGRGAHAEDPGLIALSSAPLFRNMPVEFEGSSATVVRSDEVGVEGVDVLITIGLRDALVGALRQSGAIPVDRETTEVTRIEAGRPAWGRDLNDDTIPLEAGLEDRAISQTKGCYVGQEIIIRVLHRGHGRVARRLVGLVVDARARVPAAGNRIRSGERDIGTVTSATFSPLFQQPIALGYVHRDFAEPGTGVVIFTGDAHMEAAVSNLPFGRVR